MNDCIVSADDYGISQSVTDSILETVDNGVTTNVSIMPNGDAFVYAVEKYRARKERLDISVHLNLTEGFPVSNHQDVPLLVDSKGRFAHSVFGLWFAYIFSSKKKEFLNQINFEIQAQLVRVQNSLEHEEALFSINGHQHVHMLPFVFDELVSVSNTPIRIPREHLIIPSFFSIFSVALRIPGWAALSLLCARNQLKIRTNTLSDYFIGMLFSGNMSHERVSAPLTQLLFQKKQGSVEILLHPGCATGEELDAWRTSHADIDWHFSVNRKKELEVLVNPEFKKILECFKDGTLTAPFFDVFKIIRFVISGTIAAVVHVGVLVMLTELVGLWYLLSSVIGWLAGFIASFFLQKIWTFKDHSLKNIHFKTGSYLLLQISNLVLNTILIFVLTSWFGFWYVFGQVFVLVLIAIWTYFVASRIFK